MAETLFRQWQHDVYGIYAQCGAYVNLDETTSLTFIPTTRIPVWVKMATHQPVEQLSNLVPPQIYMLGDHVIRLGQACMGRSLEKQIKPHPRSFLAVKTYRTKREMILSKLANIAKGGYVLSQKNRRATVPAHHRHRLGKIEACNECLYWLTAEGFGRARRIDALCWSVCQTRNQLPWQRVATRKYVRVWRLKPTYRLLVQVCRAWW